MNLTNKLGVFTFGISLLELIELQSQHHIYDYENLTINYEELLKSIEKVADDDIRHILKKMVKVAPYERITFT